MYQKKQWQAAVVAAVAVTLSIGACGTTKTEPQEIALEKSAQTNPMVGQSDTGAVTYGGDPSVLVDGDTVYLYTGHDASSDEEVDKLIYNIPEYLCYSSTDLINWKPEGTVMTMDTVEWAKDDVSAWASQATKYKDKYYLYYCSWDKSGKQSIGVAVADSPTGPFTDIGEPLVRGSVTKPQLSTFNDIDPTVWIETDESGEEHRYLAWGNGMFFMCELNEDMISVKDMNGDGEITSGMSFETDDIMYQQKGLENFTEAPCYIVAVMKPEIIMVIIICFMHTHGVNIWHMQRPQIYTAESGNLEILSCIRLLHRIPTTWRYLILREKPILYITTAHCPAETAIEEVHVLQS